MHINLPFKSVYIPDMLIMTPSFNNKYSIVFLKLARPLNCVT